jgi:hypothetical protein
MFIGTLLLVSQANATLRTGPEREVTLRTADGQANPDIAASASNLRLAAWSEYIAKDRRPGIIAARIDATGATLDVDGIDLGASTYGSPYPKVASDGTDWLVAWKDLGSVYACRVSQGGQVLDSYPFLVGDSAYGEDLSVAWDGSRYVVAYLRGYWFHGLHVAATVVRVSARGQMLGQTALTAPGEITFISIAGGTGGSLVAWGQGGAMLSWTNTITPVALATSGQSVAWNGRDFLVTGVSDDALWWQLVSATGVVRTPFTFVEKAGWPRAAPLDDGFLLGWWNAGDLLCAFINDRGALVDEPLKIPGIHSFRSAGNLIVYSRTVGDPIPYLERVFVRVIENAPAMPRRRAVR